MKPESEHHGLLEDVLAEAAPPDFEAALLDGTLRAVRRRGRMRRANRGVVVAGMLTAIALAVWKAQLPTPAPAVRVVHPALQVVSSKPLPASMIVETRGGGATFVATSPKTYLLVETGSIRDPFQEINDEQLLASAGKRPVVLVRQSRDQAELLFLNSEDERGFPVP